MTYKDGGIKGLIVGTILGRYLLGSLFRMNMFDNEVEKYAREQGRNISNGIAQCINHGIKDGETNYSKLAYNCGEAHRSGGPTGDVFVLDLSTKTFIYDGSPDCAKNGKIRKFSIKSECGAHNDKELCKKVIPKLLEGNNSNENTQLYWKFDDSEEWLEYTVIPGVREGYNGFIGKNGLKNSNQNKQILVVMGTQKDEVLSSFYYLKVLIIVLLFIGLLLTIFSYLSIIYDRENN